MLADALKVTQEPTKDRKPEPSQPSLPEPEAEPQQREPFSRNRRNRKPEPLELFQPQPVIEPKPTVATPLQGCQKKTCAEGLRRCFPGKLDKSKQSPSGEGAKRIWGFSERTSAQRSPNTFCTLSTSRIFLAFEPFPQKPHLNRRIFFADSSTNHLRKI